MAQFGSALDWGSSGRRFKSCQPDAGQRVFLPLRSAYWSGGQSSIRVCGSSRRPWIPRGRRRTGCDVAATRWPRTPRPGAPMPAARRARCGLGRTAPSPYSRSSDGERVTSGASVRSVVSGHPALDGKFDGFANGIPLALRPTSRTGQGHDQVPFQAWRQGGERTGGTDLARTDFDSGEGALKQAPTVVAHRWSHGCGIRAHVLSRTVSCRGPINLGHVRPSWLHLQA